jgi:hypothetical protein
MVRAAIGYRHRKGTSIRHLVVDLSEGYGGDAKTAHDLLSVALLAATRPVVIDSTGEIHRIPRKRLVGFLVWEVKDPLPDVAP